MGALERLRLERIAKYDISELPSAGGNKQSRTSTKKPQGQGASTTHTTNISNKIPVPKPEHMGTGGTRIDPKTGKPQVGGERVPIPGTAGGKTGMKRTFNPTESKVTHRTEQGTIGANAEQKLNTGRTTSNSSKLTTYFFKHPKTGRAHPVTEKEKKELRGTPGGKIDDKLAEIKARKQQRAQRKESPTKIDNKFKPGEKEKLQAKHVKWKKRKEEAEKKRAEEIEAKRAEAETDTKSEEARIASESKLSHSSQRRTLRRIAEERKRKEEGESKETMYRRRGRKDEKTRHYAWGSDDETPEISEKEYEEGEKQIGEKQPTSTEESSPKSTKLGEAEGKKREDKKQKEDEDKEKWEEYHSKKREFNYARRKREGRDLRTGEKIKKAFLSLRLERLTKGRFQYEERLRDDSDPITPIKPLHTGEGSNYVGSHGRKLGGRKEALTAAATGNETTNRGVRRRARRDPNAMTIGDRLKEKE